MHPSDPHARVLAHFWKSIFLRFDLIRTFFVVFKVEPIAADLILRWIIQQNSAMRPNFFEGSFFPLFRSFVDFDGDVSKFTMAASIWVRFVFFVFFLLVKVRLIAAASATGFRRMRTDFCCFFLFFFDAIRPTIASRLRCRFFSFSSFEAAVSFQGSTRCGRPRAANS